jgi:hypothetical protein
MLIMVACHIAMERCSNATNVQGFRYSRGTASAEREHGDLRRISSRPTMRMLAPNACGGKLDLNFDLTTPLLPWGRVTRLYDQ